MDVCRTGGGGGQANADACVNFACKSSNFADAGGGGSKMTQFCGRPLWMPPNGSGTNFLFFVSATVHWVLLYCSTAAWGGETLTRYALV